MKVTSCLSVCVAMVLLAAPIIAQEAVTIEAAAEALATAPADAPVAVPVAQVDPFGGGTLQVQTHALELNPSVNVNFTGKLGAAGQAWTELAKAKTEDERRAAREKLRVALTKEFEADVKRRRAELDKIRQKLSDLEESLQKRIDNKDKVVELRLQVLSAEAEGLGWASPATATNAAQHTTLFDFGAPERRRFNSDKFFGTEGEATGDHY